MKITWYGHAAFLIETAGVRIILNPYKSPDSGGYEADRRAGRRRGNQPRERPLSQPPGPDRATVRGGLGPELPPDGVDVRGIRFRAIPCFETSEKLPGDGVAILHFRSEGLHVVHLGDLGHPLSGQELAP